MNRDKQPVSACNMSVAQQEMWPVKYGATAR